MSSSKDPAATDLDYYMKPENYEGSSLQSFKKFQVAKDKEDKEKQVVKKEKKVKDAKYYFFNRYKHILKDAIFIGDLLDREREESSDEEEEEEDVPEQSRKAREAGKPAVPAMGAITEEEEERESKSPTLTPVPQGLDVIRPTSQRSSRSLRSVDIPTLDKSTSGTASVRSGDETYSTSPDSTGVGSPTGKKASMGAGRQSVAFQRAKMDEMSRKIRARELKEKFKKACVGIKCICRLAASARGKQSTGGSSMRTFMDIAGDETSTADNMKNQGLSFDPSYYKAKKEISLSNETKMILTTPSELRTPEQVQTAMFGLQSLRSYAEYPLHMQEKLANVAWYEVVAPKRIIIRQGHVAENFYFVLSGHAVVTILLRNPQTGASFVKTATVMKKGMSFGELALLHHSKRTATVTSQDQVQLLSIGREDFFDIFMAGQGEDNMPDHVRFISNLEFMKDWPIQLLIEHPEHCLLHFYKRNTTIVPDSNNSDWMYIVKSGSCQVLKKLKGVTAHCGSTKRQSKCGDDDLTNLKCVIFEPKVDTGLRKRKQSTNEKDNEKQQESEESETTEASKDTKFSKEAYSKFPPTKKVYFSVESSFAKRKIYSPPPASKPKKPETQKEPPAPVKPGPVFVQVSNMKPRDIFGLDTVEFDDDIQRSNTSVSLISRGAECVMLSKEFFAKHANELVKKRIRHMVRPYPEEDVFQENFQIKEDWNLYKKVLLNDVTSQMKMEKDLLDTLHNN